MTSPTEQITVSDEQLCIFMDQLLAMQEPSLLVNINPEPGAVPRYSLYCEALACIRVLEYALSPDHIVFDATGKPSLQKVPVDEVPTTTLFKSDYHAVAVLHRVALLQESLSNCLDVVRKYFNEMTAHILSSPELSQLFMIEMKRFNNRDKFTRLTYSVRFTPNASPLPQEADFLSPMGCAM